MTKSRRAKRYSPEEKESLLSAYRKSGKTIKTFCSEANVSDASLSRWLRESGGGKRSSRKNAGAQKKSIRKRKGGPYPPEARKEAVEAYLKSGILIKDFSRVWGVGESSLYNWVKQYQEKGPKSLERGIYGQSKTKRGPKGIGDAKIQAILGLKEQYPEFGLKRMRDLLYRWKGVKVASGTIRNTLKKEGLHPPLPKRKRPRKKRQVRRFERALPMQLWQSDITSYVLRRHSQRVYLTVFMDDYSRYVVSWALNLHQKAELVQEALLDGIQRFGKPDEVLTDQGRQYFSWRGKSEFQRLLEKQGIKHVVARSHHPQTLGKCERFWETVMTEFWDRARPQELREARERLGHFMAHYNHFRPHQGIGGGLVPADRFFATEKEIREAIERELDANELQMALEEPLRDRVYLVGQVGDQRIAMHGEKGRIVFHTQDGVERQLKLENLGVKTRTEKEGEDGKEGDSIGEGSENSRSNPAESSIGESHIRDESEAGPPAWPEERLVQGTASGGTGSGSLGSGDHGGSGACAPVGDSDNGVLDRPEFEGGYGEKAPGPTASGVADEPTGSIGDGCGAFEAAEIEERTSDFYESGGGSEETSEEDRGVGENSGDAGAVDLDFKGDAGLPGRENPHGGVNHRDEWYPEEFAPSEGDLRWWEEEAGKAEKDVIGRKSKKE